MARPFRQSAKAAQAEAQRALRDPTASSIALYESASPSLLSMQPAELVERQPRIEEGWGELRNHLETRLKQMYTWRLSWWEHWALLARYILPRRYHWLITPNTMTRGNPINQEIVDSTGTLAMRVCAAGLVSGLTSPSRQWFKLRPALAKGQQLDRDAQIWIEDTEDRMYQVMGSSNFYDSIAQMDEDLVTFGTGPMIIYEDEQDVIRCFNPCAGEYMLAVGPSFRVESFFRQFVMTIAQIVEFFGLENCPPDVVGMWESKGAALETERIIAHAIEPNFAIRSNRGPEMKMVAEDFTFRELYWVWGSSSDKPLSTRGFMESPAIAPRWAVTSNDPYGRGPGMDALPDIIQLQVETKRKAEGMEKQVRPPLLASAELKNQPSSILPGNVTYVNNLGPNTGMRPVFEVQPELQYITADIKEVQARIKQAFFNDLFLMLSQATKDMTAYEVAQRQQEKLQVLGPVIERLQNEGLSQAIKRIYGIVARKRLLKPMPKSLQGIPLRIEYVSMLVLAQRAAATAGIERVLGTAGSMAGTVPDVMDLIDTDVALKKYGDLLTVSPEIFRDPKAVAQIRKTRAAAQQKQMDQKNGQDGAMAAVTAAKTLSQTPVGGGNTALGAMIGAAGGSAGQEAA